MTAAVVPTVAVVAALSVVRSKAHVEIELNHPCDNKFAVFHCTQLDVTYSGENCIRFRLYFLGDVT